MTVQYVYDEQGRKTAVLVPIEEWEALRARAGGYADDVPPEELAAFDTAVAELGEHPESGIPVEDVARKYGIKLDE
jgi:hypothetical protein